MRVLVFSASRGRKNNWKNNDLGHFAFSRLRSHDDTISELSHHSHELFPAFLTFDTSKDDYLRYDFCLYPLSYVQYCMQVIVSIERGGYQSIGLDVAVSSLCSWQEP